MVKAKSEKKSGQAKDTAAKTLFDRFSENPYFPAAIACIAIIAVAAAVVMLPEQAEVEDFWKDRPAQNGDKTGEGQLKMIIVTSERCSGCEVNNSLEFLFQANNINYVVNSVEESTEDGRGLIQATGVKKLPAFIIEEESLADSMLVRTKSGISPLKDVLHFYVGKGKGTYDEGIFAFPEMVLDSGVIRSNLLLRNSCGNETNFSVDLFADPYDPNTIGRSKDFEILRNLIESEEDINISFSYNYLPTYSLIMQDNYLKAFGGKPEIVKNNLQQPANYLICANDAFETEQFNQMQQGIYSKYCDIDANTIKSGNVRPLLNCSDSNHFDIFLTADELKEAAEEVGIYNSPSFAECIFDVDKKVVSMEKVADQLLIERTPTVLVNCYYEVPVDKVLAAICTINDSLNFCFVSQS